MAKKPPGGKKASQSPNYQDKRRAVGFQPPAVQGETGLPRGFGWMGLILRYPVLSLVALIVAVYARTLPYGFTELDDSIFIREIADYHRQWSNFFTSFRRGVFHETNDVYYRPLLLNSFLINYQLAGENITTWRVVNIVFHCIATLLLFRLFKRLSISQSAAFFLSAVFAVHPALAQAVVWIPGRNDSLLAIFVIGFILLSQRYVESGRFRFLGAQAVLSVAALFTKETAVFAFPAAWLLLVFWHQQKLFSRPMIALSFSWVVALGLWLGIRHFATLNHRHFTLTDMVATLLDRLPALVQYLGKALLPIHLGVFPTQQDTPMGYGLAALLLLVLLLIFSMRHGSLPVLKLWTGAGWYLLFFVPALLVPPSFNDQDFEHRLYLPIVGVLLVLSETILIRNRLPAATRFGLGLLSLGILAGLNLHRQPDFKDPITYWTAAVTNSPRSAYANMMLGARLDTTDSVRADSLIRLAFRQDSSQKYINYYMGMLLQSSDSVLASEPYFLRELKKSDFSNCYFHLARVAFEKNDKKQAIVWLEEFLRRVPDDPQANHNLMLLYWETGDYKRLRYQVERIRVLGLSVPAEITQALSGGA